MANKSDDNWVQIVCTITAIISAIIGGILGAQWLGFIGFLLGLIGGGIVGFFLGFVLSLAGVALAAIVAIGIAVGLLYLVYSIFT